MLAQELDARERGVHVVGQDDDGLRAPELVLERIEVAQVANGRVEVAIAEVLDAPLGGVDHEHLVAAGLELGGDLVSDRTAAQDDVHGTCSCEGAPSLRLTPRLVHNRL